MVTGDVLYHLACNIYKKGFCVPYKSELNYSEGCILSCTLSAFISSSKCHCFSWSMFPLLKPQWDMCNCCILATCTCNSLLSACPRDKHYACQASYLDHKQTNRGAAWKQGGHPPTHSLICSLLDPTASVDGGGREVARTVFVWTQIGSGFQSQHTPAWLSASERRVPLFRRLRRNASFGSAADKVAATVGDA